MGAKLWNRISLIVSTESACSRERAQKSCFRVHVPTRKEEAAPKIHEEWSLVYLGTVGALAGFLGSVTSLVANVLGAWALGIERLMLLRVYATIFEGSDALGA